MIKRYLPFALAALITGPIASGQSIVTTIPQYQTAVLEEYTGIYCQYCPDGHLRAKELKADYSGRVILINIHQGGYANPSGTDPDFRTPWGNALAAQTGLTGYPTGTVNRMLFSDLGTSMAISRGQWRTAAEEVISEPSPVNIGATTSYDPSTREITINVEAYYTGDAEENINLLNIALVQDSILGPQTGAAAWNPGDILPGGKYKHDHMLRDLITGQWGDTITNTTSGSLYSKTFTYTIPNDVNGVTVDPDKCHLSIFITEDKKKIRQGISIDIDNGSNDGNHAPYYGSFTDLSQAIAEGTASTPITFNFDMAPTIPGEYTFELTTNAPSGWSHSFAIEGIDYENNDTLMLTEGITYAVAMEIIPGSNNAIEEFTLTASPVEDPNTKIAQKVYVIKGISDLVVNGSGAYGDGNTYNWESLYTDALNTTSGNTSFEITSASFMTMAMESGALENVENIYLNIGWTFPSFSNDEAYALMDFMDAGGNVFVSGQDIGWDINDVQGYGTAITRRMYKDYFNASYESDNAAQNSLNALASDEVFGSVGTVNIGDKYNGNFYPEEISPINGAQAIFTYSNTDATGGIRFENSDFKVVYLGVGLEMITDAGIRNKVLKLSHDWFNNMVSTEEFDLGMQKLAVYPNPSKGSITLETAKDGDFAISVVNMAGKEVYHSVENIPPQGGSFQTLKLELSRLPSGVYTLKATNEKDVFTEKIIIQ